MISHQKSAALKEQATNYLQSDDFKSIVPYLMSGGVGALAGGAMTGRRRKDSGEGRLGYLARILRNALITGGLAGGAHALLDKGVEKTVGNLSDSSKALTGTPGDEGPMATATKNIAFSPLTAAGAGAGALALTHNNSTIGAGDTSDAMKRFSKDLPGKHDSAWMRTSTPGEIASTLEGIADPKKVETLERLRRAAGVPSSHITPGGNGIGNLLEKIPGIDAANVKGALSSAARRGPLSTFGQSWPRRAGRGALALTAASLPALIGALVTSDSSPSSAS
jgi:hypothetical protein